MNGIGPLGMLGMLLAGVLGATLLLFWVTQRAQPAHAGTGAFAGGERPWQEEIVPESSHYRSFARYEQPPQAYQAQYEQPQAQYPEMPFDGPRTHEPGRYD